MRHNARYTVCGITGDPAPSKADIAFTREIRAAAETLTIDLLDHVIIGGGGTFFSFRDAGLLC